MQKKHLKGLDLYKTHHMQKLKLFVFIILIVFSLNAQDEFTQQGVYIPDFFPELLDAEIYSPNVLYIVGVGGFVFVDISNINNPSFIGRYNPISIFKRFYNGKAKNNLATGAARLDGLYFINISSLSNPSLFKIHQPGYFSYESVDFKDSLAYAAVHEFGIEVINISDYSNPVSVHTVGGLHNAWDVFIKDNYLYVADGAEGLKIFSLTDPVNPVLISHIPTSGSAFEVIVKNQYAYVALGAAGFDIIQVSSPSNPYFISNFNPGFGILNHLDIYNNIVFTASWELVFAIDISDPYQPVLLATEDTPIRAMGIAVQNNNVYVTDWGNLKTYTFTSLSQPDIHVKPTIYDFGYPGANVPSVKDFEIFNLGETDLVVSDISTNNMTYYTIQPTQLTVAPGESQSVTVSFTNSQPGNLNHVLTFTSNDPDESQVNNTIFAGRERAAPGQPASEFTLTDLSGKSHTLSDYRGKVVIFAVFASW